MSNAYSAPEKTGKGSAWGWIWALIVLGAVGAFAIYTPFWWFVGITGVLGAFALWCLAALITEWGNLSKEGGLGVMVGLFLVVFCAFLWLVRAVARYGINISIHIDWHLPPLMQLFQ